MLNFVSNAAIKANVMCIGLWCGGQCADMNPNSDFGTHTCVSAHVPFPHRRHRRDMP